MLVRPLLALAFSGLVLFSPAGASDAPRDAILADLRSRVAQANVALSGAETCGTDAACQALLRSYGLDPVYFEMGEEEMGEACERDDDRTACDWLDAIFLPPGVGEARQRHQDACRATPDHDDCAAFRRD
ncbi:hypothetical protein ACJ4V0_15690 [Phreatobacter sp. HK31-P]